MINNLIGINYHYSAWSRERSDGLVHGMIQYSHIHNKVSLFMFLIGYLQLWWERKWPSIRGWMNGQSDLNVVCRAGGEVSQQRLWDVQVLCHLREGGIRVRTHLLVPMGMRSTWSSALYYIFISSVTKQHKEAIKAGSLAGDALVHPSH